MSAAPEIDEVVDELRRQGWSVDRTSRGHYKAWPPDTALRMVTFADSSEYRSSKNNLSLLRRSGVVWPPPPRSSRTSQAQPEEPPMPMPQPAVQPALLPASTPPTPEPPPAPAPALDQLFLELKRLREHLVKTTDEVKFFEEVVSEAEQTLGQARLELQTARERRDAART